MFHLIINHFIINVRCIRPDISSLFYISFPAFLYLVSGHFYIWYPAIFISDIRIFISGFRPFFYLVSGLFYIWYQAFLYPVSGFYISGILLFYIWYPFFLPGIWPFYILYPVFFISCIRFFYIRPDTRYLEEHVAWSFKNKKPEPQKITMKNYCNLMMWSAWRGICSHKKYLLQVYTIYLAAGYSARFPVCVSCWISGRPNIWRNPETFSLFQMFNLVIWLLGGTIVSPSKHGRFAKPEIPQNYLLYFVKPTTRLIPGKVCSQTIGDEYFRNNWRVQ